MYRCRFNFHPSLIIFCSVFLMFLSLLITEKFHASVFIRCLYVCIHVHVHVHMVCAAQCVWVGVSSCPVGRWLFWGILSSTLTARRSAALASGDSTTPDTLTRRSEFNTNQSLFLIVYIKAVMSCPSSFYISELVLKPLVVLVAPSLRFICSPYSDALPLFVLELSRLSNLGLGHLGEGGGPTRHIISL